MAYKAEDRLDVPETFNDRIDTMVRRHYRFPTRRTSICLHPEEWKMVDDIAEAMGITIKDLLVEIDAKRSDTQTVPSAIRVFMLRYWRDMARAKKSPYRRHVPQPIGVSISNNGKS